MYLSYFADVPSGTMIVLSGASLFIGVLAATGRRGLRRSAGLDRHPENAFKGTPLAPPYFEPGALRAELSVLQKTLGEDDRTLREAILKRLMALKKRYDPENLFRINHNIPPEPSA